MKSLFLLLALSFCAFAQNTHIYGGRIVEGGINVVGTASGTNTYTASASPALLGYTGGVTYCATFTNANTSSATININSIGAISLLRPGSAALVVGDISAGSPHCFNYNGTAAILLWVDNPPSTLPSPGATCTFSGTGTICVCTTTCTITVPPPVANYQFCAMNDDNVSTVITMSAIGSSARYENQARTAYGTAGTGTFVSSGAVGDFACIVGRDSTHYLTFSTKGTWTAN